MSDLEISPKREVTMHFAIYLEDGSVADSTKVNDKPGVVVMGDGTLTPGFEAHLLGLKAGDTKKFTVGPDDAFGQPNPENVQPIPRAQFDESIPMEEGVIVEFQSMASGPRPGVIRAVEDEQVVVDFNHPLSGQTLTFEVDILSIA